MRRKYWNELNEYYKQKFTEYLDKLVDDGEIGTDNGDFYIIDGMMEAEDSIWDNGQFDDDFKDWLEEQK